MNLKITKLYKKQMNIKVLFFVQFKKVFKKLKIILKIYLILIMNKLYKVLTKLLIWREIRMMIFLGWIKLGGYLESQIRMLGI